MINFDAHIHTELCVHAPGMTIQALLERADEVNLESILIAEHVFSSADLHLIDEIKEQVSQIKHKCQVVVGAEIDADGSKTDGSLVADGDELKKIDLVIGAVHYIPGVGNYPHSPTDNPLTGKELLSRWHSSLIGVVSNPAVDILAHPGRLPGTALDLDRYFDDVLSVLNEAAKISAENNIAWEINNLTYAKINRDYIQDWHKTIQAAVDAGLKITYGSDAHTPEDIARQNNVRQIIAKLKNFDCLTSPVELFEFKTAKRYP